MADKSFGVKELNLLNASGTPTVTSPNNLNLNANTVAISTSATVGNNLTVSGQINVGSNIKIGNAGVVTATSFVGSGANLTGISAGISTDPSNVQATWKLGGGSGSGFTFTGPGQDGSEGNPDIYLVRGQRYLFDNTTLAGSHPFEFRNEANDADYTDGVSGAQNGLQYINVQHDAPAALKYRCTIHTGSMLGNIYIVGQHLANGANNRVLTATSAYGMTGESNLTFNGTGELLVTGTNHVTQIMRAGGSTSDLQIQFKDSSGNIESAIFCASDQGDLRFQTGGSNERLRITSDGRIGINDSTPNDYELDIMKRSTATDANLRLYNNGTSSSNDTILRLHIAGTTASNYIYFGDGDDTNVGQIRYQHSNNSMQFFAGASERLRIASNGNIYTNGNTSLPTGSTSGFGFSEDQFYISYTGTSANYIQRFYNANGLIGSILANGSGVAYNTSSDYRLKENAVAISDGITRLKTLKPYRFNFKTDPTKTVDGFFAHEVTAVPEAIAGEKDGAEMQGIDHSKLVPLLTAALQEEIAKREALEARIAALEGS